MMMQCVFKNYFNLRMKPELSWGINFADFSELTQGIDFATVSTIFFGLENINVLSIII